MMAHMVTWLGHKEGVARGSGVFTAKEGYAVGLGNACQVQEIGILQWKSSAVAV